MQNKCGWHVENDQLQWRILFKHFRLVRAVCFRSVKYGSSITISQICFNKTFCADLFFFVGSLSSLFGHSSRFRFFFFWCCFNRLKRRLRGRLSTFLLFIFIAFHHLVFISLKYQASSCLMFSLINFMLSFQCLIRKFKWEMSMQIAIPKMAFVHVSKSKHIYFPVANWYGLW